MTVWLDINDDNAIVPTYDNNIFMKLTRISNSDNIPNKQSINNTTNGQDVKLNNTVGNSTSIKNEEKVKNTLLQFDDFDEVPSFVSASTNINTSASVPKAPIIQQSNSSNADLLGIDTNDVNVNPTTNKQNSSIDLFGLDTLQPTATAANPIMNNTSKNNYQANNPMMQSRGFDPFNDLVNNNNQNNR
eukprot:CAMPEP_0196761868 /NCGR_PEP_ID=MMETSP1095-20130614/1179_1 /TAXON_ID=96789 ORGANISM="Chromulina nebulosa, Strain UTEXLB2642" /NCGR_SAMPLE_ID=MMETSP1095 /ASSEMBLY_ACC=CAM_ASM_000446 /LENGTH=187 /DNA_ID=CAMNT_0042111917 /DNA_START=61 /DNA_END=620 /DNA_ORIENTATION=-